MPRKVFIAYDFDIKGTLTVNLEAVKKRAPKDFEVEWPGSGCRHCPESGARANSYRKPAST
jgi:hypothetical protein